MSDIIAARKHIDDAISLLRVAKQKMVREPPIKRTKPT